MKMRHSVGVVGMCALLAVIAVAGERIYGQAAGRGAAPRGRGPESPPRSQPRHPSGKLIVTGDVALFIKPGDPDNCILTNRFRHGQRLGFRMTATDGGTGEPENTAMLTAHLTVAGRKIEVPMRFRGDAPTPPGYLSAPYNLWTGFWVVPADAPTGMLRYTVTATDKFGRTAEFVPYSYEASQLTIVP